MSSVMTVLREETRAEHEATERTDLAQAMLAGTMGREAYKAQLAAYRQIHSALEASLARAASRADVAVAVAAVVALVAVPAMKSDVLDADLAALDRARVAALDSLDLRAAVGAAVERLRASSDAELLGALYVLEGSALGAVVLVPRLRSSASLALGDDAFGYYRGHGADTRSRWRTFSAAMDRALPGRASQDAAVASARRMFHAIGAMFAAISAAELTASRAPPSS